MPGEEPLLPTNYKDGSGHFGDEKTVFPTGKKGKKIKTRLYNQNMNQ
jgi:hypothetical protein